jgi:carboxymethylenebutenolidase
LRSKVRATAITWLGPAALAPGLEWWGLDDHIKSIADRFAAEGFAALAPDLYNGQVATEPDEARKLRMALVWDEALV